jgi:hypothetical protein
VTRRKREIVGLTNERDFPHLVELALPPGGFRSVFLEIDAFHRDRRIPVRRGRSRHEAERFHIRFCFPDTATADAFSNRFGGECLTHGPGKPKPRASATSSDASAVKREAEEAVELEPVTQQSAMVKNLLGCLPKFTPPQVELIIFALAAYLALPREQLKGDWVGQIAVLSPKTLRDALINAVSKGLLTFGEANEIASIIGASLYNRGDLR